MARSSERTQDEQRRLGVFYTPTLLSEILSRWAIRHKSDQILEPSFGGCGFLAAARDRLIQLGCQNFREQIYGYDVDIAAFQHLSRLLGGPLDLERFVHADFLTSDPPGSWPHQFNTILANPPYVPYQAIEPDRRAALAGSFGLMPSVGGRASLWAYFMAHAVSFLAEGGRMAWVLPGAFLQADYAKPIHSYLQASFERVIAIVLRERVFLEAGTDEETVILLADGHRPHAASCCIALAHADTLKILEDVIRHWDADRLQASDFGRPAASSLSAAQRALVSTFTANPHRRRLSDVLRLKIGIVTGANKFFVLNQDQVEAIGLNDADVRPILAKFRMVSGLELRPEDHARSLDRGERGWLVHGRADAGSLALRSYLDTFEAELRAANSTFSKRRIWSEPDDGQIPDAFFPVMHHNGPRLVLNRAAYNCTNTIHRAYFHQEVSAASRQLACIALQASLSQLSAEMVGRRYGSGVLKHEPREAERIDILMPPISPSDVERTFEQIHDLLCRGDTEAAMAEADKVIYEAAGHMDVQSAAVELRSALETIRRHRKPDRSLPKSLLAPVAGPHRVQSG